MEDDAESRSPPLKKESVGLDKKSKVDARQDMLSTGSTGSDAGSSPSELSSPRLAALGLSQTHSSLSGQPSLHDSAQLSANTAGFGCWLKLWFRISPLPIRCIVRGVPDAVLPARLVQP